jgi:hypothetical protein
MGQEDVEALGREVLDLAREREGPDSVLKDVVDCYSHYLLDERVLARGVRTSSMETDLPNQSPPARFNTGRACHEGCL